MPTDQLVGSADRVAEGLRALVTRTHANELMLTAATFDVADRVRSLELIDAALR
jgi:alkanesulfonate monooxygenase SsuD/methylene tetrahydromethanopterin reductase-like flavin-dependent oxidoreductase (luciferase family)